jgi:integrase
MAKSHLALVTPSTVFGSVTRGRPPKRRRNAEARSREYLTASEVEQLIAAAGNNRYGHRDATMVLVAYRHGLRPAEAIALRWDAIDFNQGKIHIARVKGSAASVHPLTGRELRALRRLKREQDPASSFVFTSERGAPFATGGFRTLIARLGEAAGVDFRVHPHMLRHACGARSGAYSSSAASPSSSASIVTGGGARRSGIGTPVRLSSSRNAS